MTSPRRWSPVLLILLALAACGPVPRPFQPEVKRDNALFLLRNGSQLQVLPLEQAPPGVSDAFAERLVRALRFQGLTATTLSDGPDGYRLRGRASVNPLADGREEVLTLWELVDGRDRRLAQRAQRSELPGGHWQLGSPGALDQVASDVADSLVELVRAPANEARPDPVLADGRLLLAPIEGAPGSSGQFLAQALAAELRRLEPTFPGVRRGPALVILGKVGLGQPRAGWQRVALTWRVVEAISGEELGRINQRNSVPAGSLDDTWNDLAKPIAEGAAIGIADVLKKTGRS